MSSASSKNKSKKPAGPAASAKGGASNGKGSAASAPPLAARERMLSASAAQCVICCHESDFYCLGPCGHPVCCECGIRLRVLCASNDCPICRANMPQMMMISLESLGHFNAARPPPMKKDKIGNRFQMNFESKEAVEAFTDLLAHVCTVCKDEPEFPTFLELQKHMKRIHADYYCELCVEHLKLFSWERKTYRRADLLRHERDGDDDDRSHRGHPGCQFCRRRFLDPDALFLHLRREHYFCHFCDADGAPPAFYDQYPQLADHFGNRHFLCTEGDCAREQFTPAFRTKMDFEMHQASHKDKSSKARVLNLEWGAPARPGLPNGTGRDGRDGGRRGRGGAQSDRGGRGGGRPLPYHRQRELEEAAKNPGPKEEEELVPVANGSGSSKIQSVIRVRTGGVGGETTEEYRGERRDFPSLRDGGVTTSDGFSGFAGASGRRGDWNARNVPTATLVRRDSEDFPTLGPSSRNQRPQPGTQRQQPPSQRPVVQPAQRQEDFPSLGPSSRPQRQQPSSQQPVVQSSHPTPQAGAPKKAEPRGMMMIDDDESFPSLKVQMAAEAEAKATADKAKQQKKAAQQQTQAPKAAALQPTEEEDEQTGGASSGYMSRLGSKPWAGAQSLSQATACLTSEFPVLYPAPGSKGPPIKGAWVARTAAASHKKKAFTVSEPGEELDFDWIKTDAKKSEAKPKKEKKTPKTAASNMVKVGTKAKARLVARAKQNADEHPAPPIEETREPSPRRSPSPPSAPPPGLRQPSPTNAVPPPGLEGPPGLSRPSPTPPSPPPPPGYQKPRDFAKRNKSLFEKIWAQLTPKQLDTFKAKSREFRSGDLSAEAYASAVEGILGHGPFVAFLPELLALLPDISKQRAFHAVSAPLLSTVGGGRGASAWGGSVGGGLSSCANCGQLLQDWDAADHADSHRQDASFPALGH